MSTDLRSKRFRLIKVKNIIRYTMVTIRRMSSKKRRSILSKSSLLLLSQRCVSSLEIMPFERRSAAYRSCLESLYLLIEQLINEKGQCCEEYQSQLNLIVEQTGANNINDCLQIIIGLNNGARLQKLLLAEYPILYPLIVNNVKPFRVRYVPYGRNSPDVSASILDKMKTVKDIDIIQCGRQLDCIDLCRSEKEFLTRVHGADILFRDRESSRWIVISCMVSNVCPMSLHSPWITKRRTSLFKSIMVSRAGYDTDLLNRGIDLVSLKDYFVYSDEELTRIYLYNIDKVKETIKRPISGVATEFLTLDRYQQRKQLVRLLLCKNKCEYYYTAYLLYDLLSTESEVSSDTVHQLELLSSLPWKARVYFKEAMISTVRYTETLSLGEEAKIPLAQQVCLLKVNDRTKSKAMNKLREVRAKSEDSGSKARQFLEGLLRIPFGSYREEDILSVCKRCVKYSNEITTSLGNVYKLDSRSTSSLASAKSCLIYLSTELIPQLKHDCDSRISDWYCKGTKQDVVLRSRSINEFVEPKERRIRVSKNLESLKKDFKKLVDARQPKLLERLKMLGCPVELHMGPIAKAESAVKLMQGCMHKLSSYMTNISLSLDEAVHGHVNAKRQVQRIIGQWMTGESSGYCFGFEGPPGIGKTSLARKGIARCLTDDNGIARPFSFIAIGGASNSSTLDGHNYTYVGSTWGRIVDTIMEAGCLNPIIFIDELDKISRTEHGKEIIGILTHLVDPSQNECFQDKYFAGVDIDLSKALIIFSYNDASLIDKILLDRIHRVKFDALTLEEKITITEKYLIPEAISKMGLPESIQISREGIESIITEYTQEAGVRTLKEILFEIFGEINLQILNGDYDLSRTIIDSMEIKCKYLKNRVPCILTRALDTPTVGVVCGLWANSLGLGGVLHIQIRKSPNGSKGLELKLTGNQGDVMKESVDVALSIARQYCAHLEHLNYSLHVHVPDAATPKDGPSAGVAITCGIISCLLERTCDNLKAITGEICLQRRVKAVGGLDAKIAGAVRAGIKQVFYPTESHDEIIRLISIGLIDSDSIKLTPISSLEDVLDKVLIKT